MTEETGAVEATDAVVVEADAPVVERSGSTQEAVERAFDKVFGDEARDEARGETKPEGPNRAPDGKFAPKEAQEAAAEAQAEPEAPKQPQPMDEAPARFSADAKAAWAAASPAVRGEVHRMTRELEQGIEKYRAQVEPVRQFIERAGSPEAFAQAVQSYVAAEDMLRQDPIRGLDNVCKAMGTTLRDVAAQVMGQPAPEKDAVIEELRRELRAVQSQVGTVAQTFEQQRQQALVGSVTQFAASHPRFDELSGEIARMLKTGYASDLEDAYAKAERLNPAPAPAASAAPPPAPQTRKSALSVNGAPSSGSNPATRQRSATTGDAIARAFEQVGIPTS